MFKSFDFTNGFGKIIDSDFEHNFNSRCNWWDVACVYEKRGLPVAENFIRAIIFCCNTSHKGSTIQNMVKYAYLGDSELLKYKNDIDKYLCLL
jgi:hypothetical protein